MKNKSGKKQFSRSDNVNGKKEVHEASVFPFRSFLYTLLFIAFALYFNSLFNQFAFDDGTYILENSYVQQGFGGIGKILSADALESYIKNKNNTASSELSGGRYRPLSLVTFAIEKSLFDNNAFISHLINVLLYLVTIAVLFKLVNRRIFPNNPTLSFLTVLIFVIHPLHTEVVANIKSRDEILSLLFLLLSLDYFFKYQKTNFQKEKIYSWLLFFLALLSKEYGLFFVLFIPAVSYVLLKKDIKGSISSVAPFFFISLIYIFIRIRIVGFHTSAAASLVNNPYLLADVQQKIATKIFVLFYYLKLLVFPFPLSCDYSYNTFPYRSLIDPMVLLSIISYGFVIFIGIYWLVKRNVLSLGVLFFLLPLFLVSNLVIDIGATMGERLVYHSSVGFAMIVGYGIFFILKKGVANEKARQKTTMIIGGVLAVCTAFIIIPRNAQWKNSGTLFTHDVTVVPNSLLMNHNAALKLMEDATTEKNGSMKDSLFHLAVYYLKRDESIYPKWEYIPVSLGAVYYNMGNRDSAAITWKKATQDFPGLEMAKTNLAVIGKDYFNEAVSIGKKGNLDSSLVLLKKAIDADSTNTTYWYNIGGVYYSRKNFASARLAWEKTLQIDPNFKDAKGGLEAIRRLSN